MKELCPSITLPIYHASIDSLSSLLSYHLVKFFLEMIQPEEDDITMITMSQLNQLFAQLQHLEIQRAISLSALVPLTFLLSFTSAFKSHITDSFFFFDKHHEFYNFLFKCRLKFIDQLSKFTTEIFKIYYLDSHLADQAYF